MVCAHLFQRFRQRAVNAPVEFARTFPTAEARQGYEEIWRVMIDEIVQELPDLRTEMVNFDDVWRASDLEKYIMGFRKGFQFPPTWSS